jgi:hypothetical protein
MDTRRHFADELMAKQMNRTKDTPNDGKYQLTVVYMRLEKVSNDETLNKSQLTCIILNSLSEICDQRQETLDLPYLTLLYDNLKK